MVGGGEHEVDAGIETGAIIIQKRIVINDLHTPSTLLEDRIFLGLECFIEIFPLLLNGS